MTAFLVTTSLGVALVAFLLLKRRPRARSVFKDKSIVITGGSQGLGLAIAEALAPQAGRITLIARSPSKLEKAIAALSKTAKEVNFSALDVCDYSQLEQASRIADAPDIVFCCAGASRPGWFLKQDIKELQHGMDVNYFGALYTARVYAKRMIEQNKRGRIVFISSTVGLMGMVGFSQYAPAKFALRGLAECLNQELLPHGISVHVYFVASIDTPGFEDEQRTKPLVTRIIEGQDVSGDQSASARAGILLRGLDDGKLYITSDAFTSLLLGSTAGLYTDGLWGGLMGIAGSLAMPWVRTFFERIIMRAPTFDMNEQQ